MKVMMVALVDAKLIEDVDAKKAAAKVAYETQYCWDALFAELRTRQMHVYAWKITIEAITDHHIVRPDL